MVVGGKEMKIVKEMKYLDVVLVKVNGAKRGHR
jgi:hypothetical protein